MRNRLFSINSNFIVSKIVNEKQIREYRFKLGKSRLEVHELNLSRIVMRSIIQRLRSSLKFRGKLQYMLGNSRNNELGVDFNSKGFSSVIPFKNFPIKREMDTPITFGPWTGELGMELLYWAPWVTSFAANSDYVISRGGASFLYPNVQNYLDVLDHKDLEWWNNYQQTLLKSNGGEKQRHWIPSEFTLVKQMESMKSQNALFAGSIYIHPKEFFRHFYLSDPSNQNPLENFVNLFNSKSKQIVYQHSQHLNLDELFKNTSKDDRIAFGVYTRDGVGINEIEKFLENKIVKLQLRNKRIFSLQNNFTDIHHNQVSAIPNLEFPLMNFPVSENLLTQAALISNCDTLVTTHGGLAYLGLLLGKNVLALEGTKQVWLARHASNANFVAKLNQVNFEVVIC